MDFACKSPLVLFARILVLNPLGIVAILLSMLRGVTTGALVPLLFSRLIENLGKSEVTNIVKWLTLCLLAAMVFDIAERWLMNTVKRQCREKLVNYIAYQLAQAPPASEEDGHSHTSLSRFFSSFSSAAHIYLSALPGLVVGMGGFLLVLILEQAPWQIFVAAGIFTAMPLSAHWLFKRVKAFREALKKEGEELEALELIYEDRKDTQAQPALHRYRHSLTEEVWQLRRRADNSMLVHTATRAILCAAICITVVQIVPFAPAEVTTLLIVFALTFTQHISSLYYFAEFFHKINTEGAALLVLINQPKKPPLPPARAAIDGAWINIKDLQVTYPGENVTQATCVQLGDFSIRGTPATAVLLNAPNGKGKTTLAKILDGSLTSYEGSVNCWGYEIKDYDSGKRIMHFTQTRRPKPITLCELFKGETWTTADEQLMQRTLQWAGIPKINLDKLHNQLSEGQRQKADLALFFFRAIKDKGVFVCIIDEPMNHIAWPDKPIVSRGIYEFLCEFDSTALVISHDPIIKLPMSVTFDNQFIEAVPFHLPSRYVG